MAISTFHDIYGFLSKEYWSSQDDYIENTNIERFFQSVKNHVEVFNVSPIDNVTLYDNEWHSADNIEDAIEELENDNSDAIVVGNWKDSEGRYLYTLVYKDDTNTPFTKTRACPSNKELRYLPKYIIDNHWHPYHLDYEKENDLGGDSNNFYVWESSEMYVSDFIDLFNKLAQKN